VTGTPGLNPKPAKDNVDCEKDFLAYLLSASASCCCWCWIFSLIFRYGWYHLQSSTLKWQLSPLNFIWPHLRSDLVSSKKEYCQNCFFTQDSIYAIARICYRPSVCHTGGSYKTVEGGIMKFSPYSSPISLVFRQQVSSWNSEGFPQSGGVKWGWGR